MFCSILHAFVSRKETKNSPGTVKIHRERKKKNQPNRDYITHSHTFTAHTHTYAFIHSDSSTIRLAFDFDFKFVHNSHNIIISKKTKQSCHGKILAISFSRYVISNFFSMFALHSEIFAFYASAFSRSFLFYFVLRQFYSFS